MNTDISLSNLTPKQSETFAILLSEGYDYIPSYEASLFYAQNLTNARDYARVRQSITGNREEANSNPPGDHLKVNAICVSNPRVSFEMKIENNWKQLTLLYFINSLENKLNEIHLKSTKKQVKRLTIVAIDPQLILDSSLSIEDKEKMEQTDLR